MAKRNTDIDRLNDAIENMMTHPDRQAPRVDSQLDELLRIAGTLRDLPSSAFKARLKAELLAEAERVGATMTVPPHYGNVLMTVDDYIARLAQFASQPPLKPFDLDVAFRGVADGGTRFLNPMNECAIGVSRSSRPPHWERHNGGDELLYILDGEADVLTVTADGPVHSQLQAGSIFVCPQGLWHKVTPRTQVSMFFATPMDTQSSKADGPPEERATTAPPASLEASAATLIPQDLGEALRDLPTLAITADTTEEEANAAVRPIGRVGVCTIGVIRFTGLTPWERHPDGDELLHVLDGAVDLTVLTDDGPTDVTLDAGSVFVCPRGLWHRQQAHGSATLLFGTPAETTEASFADDPRPNA